MEVLLAVVPVVLVAVVLVAVALVAVALVAAVLVAVLVVVEAAQEAVAEAVARGAEVVVPVRSHRDDQRPPEAADARIGQRGGVHGHVARLLDVARRQPRLAQQALRMRAKGWWESGGDDGGGGGGEDVWGGAA